MTSRSKPASSRGKPMAPSLVNMADTVVLVTAVGEKKDVAGRDFFPLTVNYQEKTYAAGQIPGGFFKREGRPSEKETLTSRLIDRPIRPLFPAGFQRDVQVIATVLSMNHGGRSRYSGSARRFRRALLVRACRSWARSAGTRRLQGRPVPVESDERGAGAVEARPRRRRHARRRADGGVASRPAVRKTSCSAP